MELASAKPIGMWSSRSSPSTSRSTSTGCGLGRSISTVTTATVRIGYRYLRMPTLSTMPTAAKVAMVDDPP